MLEIQELSSEITNMLDAKRHAKHDVESSVIHLVEEVGEIAREVINKKFDRAPTDVKKFEAEIADAFIMLAHIANLLGIDIESSVKNKAEELKVRYGV